MDTAWGDDNEEVDELDTDSELVIGDVRGEEEAVGIAHGQHDGVACNPNPDGVLSITLLNSKVEVRVGSKSATVYAGSKLAGIMLLLLLVITASVLQGMKLTVMLHIGVGAA
ncbi:hypothetical protein PQX77_021249 [Marasmius sp. AFHP31]|nr:hypothetical protein PQX77_021249 [Marasmius sp. AFHP31]